jgi:hypothetical protein
VWSYKYLDNRPADATWLSTAEKRALEKALLRDEKSQQYPHNSLRLLPCCATPYLLQFALIYFFLQMSIYGVVFYLPSEVSTLMNKPAGFEVGLVSAIPWICALAGAYLLPRLADRLNQRRRVRRSLLQ